MGLVYGVAVGTRSFANLFALHALGSHETHSGERRVNITAKRRLHWVERVRGGGGFI